MNEPSLPYWLQVVSALGPTATLIGASIGASVAWRIERVQRRSKARDAWWARLEKAVEGMYPLDAPEREQVNIAVLGALAKSDVMTYEDTVWLNTFLTTVLAKKEEPPTDDGR